MRRSRPTCHVLTPAIALSLAPTAGAQPEFIPLGDLPGGQFSSFALAVSADGAVVVGASESDLGQEPFRWSEADGMQGLGQLYEEGLANFASDVNADGSVVIGTSGFNHTPAEAFVWTGDAGMQGLGDLPGLVVSSTGNACTADGLTVVGAATDEIGTRPARWSDEQGWHVIAQSNGEAFAVSAGGTAIAGAAWNQDYLTEAFRWTEASGVEFLGDFPGGVISSTATAISDDGAVVAGWGNDESGTRAFRWTAESGLQLIDQGLDSVTQSQAEDVNGNGSVIVGTASFGLGFHAFVWTTDDGATLLQDELLARGASGLDGWTLTNANGVSADGLSIVGAGLNPDGVFEAFLVKLAPACPADVNADGEVNELDFAAFQAAFLQGDAGTADCDANEALTVLDFVCFQANVQIGCE